MRRQGGVQGSIPYMVKFAVTILCGVAVDWALPRVSIPAIACSHTRG